MATLSANSEHPEDDISSVTIRILIFELSESGHTNLDGIYRL